MMAEDILRNVPGVGPVNFPDSMKAADIDAAVERLSNEAKPTPAATPPPPAAGTWDANGIYHPAGQPAGVDKSFLGGLVKIHVPAEQKDRPDSNVIGWGQGTAGVSPEMLLGAGNALASIATRFNAGGLIAGIRQTYALAKPAVQGEMTRRALKAFGVPDEVAATAGWIVNMMGMARGPAAEPEPPPKPWTVPLPTPAAAEPPPQRWTVPMQAPTPTPAAPADPRWTVPMRPPVAAPVETPDPRWTVPMRAPAPTPPPTADPRWTVPLRPPVATPAETPDPRWTVPMKAPVAPPAAETPPPRWTVPMKAPVPNTPADFAPGASSAATAAAPRAAAPAAAASPSQAAAIKVLTKAGMAESNAVRAVQTWVRNGIPNLQKYAKDWADEHLE